MIFIRLFSLFLLINLLFGCTILEEKDIINIPIPIPKIGYEKEPLKRIALIISNSNYMDDNINDLDNSTNDSSSLASQLKKMNFIVNYKNNISRKRILAEIRMFNKNIDKNTVALFFYAGHSIQNNNNNYLIPIDFESSKIMKINYEKDFINIKHAFSKNKNFQLAAIKIIILDSCRNNPFLEKKIYSAVINRDIYRDLFHRGKSGFSSLSEVNAPTGSILAYSTAPGSLAKDGIKNSLHSPYTEGILKFIHEKISISDLFKKVRKYVLEITNETQSPWEVNSLIHKFSFNIKFDRKINTNNNNDNYRFKSLDNETILDKKLNKTWKILNINKIYLFDKIKEQIELLTRKIYRLPTKEELSSLVAFQRKYDWGKIDSNFFPKNDKTCRYWTSSDTSILFGFTKWQVNFCKSILEKHLINDAAAVILISK